MFEPETRDGRVGGAAPFSVSRADERACFPRGFTADASARNDATRLDALAAVF